MPNYTETEVKLIVPDLDSVRARLETAGARLESPRVYERNVRYENVAGTLSGQGIVVRLRQDSRVRLTYKDGGQVTDGVVSRAEIEVEVSDFTAMDMLLGKLGYHPHLIGVSSAPDLREVPYHLFAGWRGDCAG